MLKYKWLGKDLQKEKDHVHGIRSCQAHTSWDHCWPLESTHITWDNFYCLFQYFKFMIYHLNLSFLRYCFVLSHLHVLGHHHLPSCQCSISLQRVSLSSLFIWILTYDMHGIVQHWLPSCNILSTSQRCPLQQQPFPQAWLLLSRVLLFHIDSESYGQMTLVLAPCLCFFTIYLQFHF